MRRRAVAIVWVGAFDFLVILAGQLLYRIFPTADVAWASLSLVAVGIVTFASGVILAHLGTDDEVGRMEEMRLAITGTFMVLYIALLGLFAFRIVPLGSNGQENFLPDPTSASLVKSFTLLMSVVVGFYFGGVTVEKLSSNRQTDRRDRSSQTPLEGS
jgi:hypothetical protein